MTADVITLPRPAIPHPESDVAKALGHPQSNVGAHPFPEPDPIPDVPSVDIIPGIDTAFRVMLRGKFYAAAETQSNAARIASALMTLVALGVEPMCPAKALRMSPEPHGEA